MSTSRLIDPATYAELQQLQAEYAAAVDAGQWDLWPEFFTEDAVYKIQPRENHECGLPLATLHFRSKGMLKDRVYAIRETLFHDPYYQRHVVGAVRVLGVQDGHWSLETNYTVFRTKLGEQSTVFNAGRYLDEVVRVEGELRFASRCCVYDSEMIPNAIIYPI